MSLADLIARQPQAILGSLVAKKFNHQLPYLFKVLAAAKPLSIQAHPGLEQARQGFEIENKNGIPLNAANRNYKDANHKPECMCALSAFWALYGFRKISDILLLMGSICPVGLVNELIDEVTHQIQQRREENSAYYWTARLAAEYPDDIGFLAPLYLNLIRLNPGQALFLPAGELHAYLEGTGIELMANSDNVLRGGLTSKHIDVTELLKVLNFKPRRIEILQAKHKTAAEKFYATPAEEFKLSAISVAAGDDYRTSGTQSAEILLCIEGEGRLEDDRSHTGVHIKKGDSAIISAATGSYSVKGEGAFYKAAVPV
jgi:mannose-6-phosphate isomerase